MAGLFRRAQCSAFQADSELGGLVGQLQQKMPVNAVRALIESISYRNLTLARHALSLRYPHFLRVTAALRPLSVKPGQQPAKQTLAVASFGRITTSTVSDCMQSPGLQGNDSGHVPSYVIRRLQEHLIRRPSRHNLSAIHPRPPPTSPLPSNTQPPTPRFVSVSANLIIRRYRAPVDLPFLSFHQTD